MVVKMTTKQPNTAQATVTKTKTEKGHVMAESTTTEKPAVGADAKELAEALIPYCQVGCAIGYTHNLGNYQSTKIEVSLTVPAKPEDINETFAGAKEWVEERINQFVAEVSGPSE